MRRAIVTGASSGIGAAIARRLLDEGCAVTGLDRVTPRIALTGLTPVAVDLADGAALDAALALLEAPDILVHAAGLMRTGPLGALDHSAGETLWRVHVAAAERLADRLGPAMPTGGRIILIGSLSARGVGGRSQYAATKAALVALAKSWGAELIQRGVTVNVVSPAVTDTAMLTDPARAGVKPVMPPIGRYIRPEEVAGLVGFLASEAAAAITGQEILICGGSSLRGM
jgi:3-oxoacyl-[acyl-carrier protein] reductase